MKTNLQFANNPAVQIRASGYRNSVAAVGCARSQRRLLLCSGHDGRVLPAGLREPACLAARTFGFSHPSTRRGRPVFAPASAASRLLRAGSPLDEVRAHLEANLDRAVPLAELGRIAGLSPFTVQRLFKKELGVSPLQYQRALRAGRLRSNLKDGGLCDRRDL